MNKIVYVSTRIFMILTLILAIIPQVTFDNNRCTTFWEDPDYFDTTFLGNFDVVAQHLQNIGFKAGFFHSEDMLALHYLYLEQPHATCNVILCCGWLPGRKEGLASFYPILSGNCNILFFDARGHGKSQGPLFSKIWQYGVHEYKDIIGAINFVKTQNQKPIIIYGTCAGAFNAAHALIALTKQQALDPSIKALIFDSGWASVTQASRSSFQAKIKECTLKGFNYWYQHSDYRHVYKTLPFKIASSITDGFIHIMHTLICKPCLYTTEKSTNLVKKIKKLKIPILFIHSHDDDYVAIEDVKQLANNVEHKICWWITEPSKHACHYLKHREQYTHRLQSFISSTLQGVPYESTLT